MFKYLFIIIIRFVRVSCFDIDHIQNGKSEKIYMNVSLPQVVGNICISLGMNGNGIELSALLNEGADLVDVEDEEEDPDSKLDPLYSVDLKKYLFNFLR